MDKILSYKNLKDLDKFSGYWNKGTSKIFFETEPLKQDNYVNLIQAWDKNPYDSSHSYTDKQLLALFRLEFDKFEKVYKWEMDNSYTDHEFTKEELEILNDYLVQINIRKVEIEKTSLSDPVDEVKKIKRKNISKKKKSKKKSRKQLVLEPFYNQISVFDYEIMFNFNDNDVHNFKVRFENKLDTQIDYKKAYTLFEIFGKKKVKHYFKNIDKLDLNLHAFYADFKNKLTKGVLENGQTYS